MVTSVFCVLLTAVGLCFTLGSGFMPLRKLPSALRSVFGKDHRAEGGMSVYSALCTDLAATLGTGNIVGVASALMIGGPGALFWMVAFSFLSMSTKCAENILAVRYRQKNGGGPFYYIAHGMGKHWTWLAKVFAFACLTGGALALGTVIQSNSIAMALTGGAGQGSALSTVLLSAAVTGLAATVILGGAGRIARFAEKLIPPLAFLYLSLCLLILLRHASRIPAALLHVVTSAFSLSSVGGAAAGHAFARCVSAGIRRGVFSNEAGLGTSPIAAGASEGDALRQGYAGIVSVFVDTTFLCALTGLTLLVTGAVEGASDAVDICVSAWQLGLPLPPGSAKLAFGVFLALFAFSTVLGWYFFAESSYLYLFPHGRGLVIYRLLYLTAVFLGPFLSPVFAWYGADIANACMAIPNLLALFALRKQALDVMNDA